MRKALLTGVAALFLATGSAHATAIIGFKCDDDLEIGFGKDVGKDGRYSTTLSITQSYGDNRNLRFKMVHPKEGGTLLYMNGKRCKTVLLDGREF